jgi:hypothetical protein
MERRAFSLIDSWLQSCHPAFVLKIALNVTKEEFFRDLLISRKCASLIFLLKEAGLWQTNDPSGRGMRISSLI